MESSEEDTHDPSRGTNGVTAAPVDDPTTDEIDLDHLANVALDRIAEQAIMHPFRTLGIAAGVGYILGRGVPSVLVRLGMFAAARVAGNAIIGASLEQISASMRADGSTEKRPPATSSTGRSRNSNGRFGGRRTSSGGAQEPSRD